MWEGTHIADIALPPICASGGSGVPDLQSTGVLAIVDLSRFTDFAAYLLLNPQFTWTITTDKLRWALCLRSCHQRADFRVAALPRSAPSSTTSR